MTPDHHEVGRLAASAGRPELPRRTGPAASDAPLSSDGLGTASSAPLQLQRRHDALGTVLLRGSFQDRIFSSSASWRTSSPARRRATFPARRGRDSARWAKVRLLSR
jgi:hypothetical protein